jgi:hypothetical protein
MAVNNLIATNLAAIGRKTVINKKLIDEVKYLKEIKNLSIPQIAKELLIIKLFS